MAVDEITSRLPAGWTVTTVPDYDSPTVTYVLAGPGPPSDELRRLADELGPMVVGRFGNTIRFQHDRDEWVRLTTRLDKLWRRDVAAQRLPQRVGCRQCGAPVGADCVTASGARISPHSRRGPDAYMQGHEYDESALSDEYRAAAAAVEVMLQAQRSRWAS